MKPDIFKMLADVPQKTVDESAFTIVELCKQSGLAETQMREQAKRLVTAGKWERVWKQSGRQLVAAYRKK